MPVGAHIERFVLQNISKYIKCKQISVVVDG